MEVSSEQNKHIKNKKKMAKNSFIQGKSPILNCK